MGRKSLIVIEQAVYRLGDDGLIVIEIAPVIDMRPQVFMQINFEVAVAPELMEMDWCSFTENSTECSYDFRTRVKGCKVV